MKRIGIIILATAAIVCSCTGQKSTSKLERAIEHALTENLEGPQKVSVLELVKLDSTIFLTEFDRRKDVFEKRIEQNKKFHDDYYRRGLKKNAAIKYDEIHRDYEILNALELVKERMGDSLYLVAYYDYRVKAKVITGRIPKRIFSRIFRRKAQVLEDLYFAVTPDNEVISLSTDHKRLHQSTGLVIPGYSEIIKSETESDSETDSAELMEDE